MKPVDAPPLEPSLPRARRARVVLSLVIAAVALWLAWRLAASIAWSDLARVIATAGRWPLLVAGACLVGRFAAAQQRWSMALGRLGGQPAIALRFFALTSAVLVNHLTPTARLLGGVFRARYLSRLGGYSFSRQYGVVLADQISHQMVQTTLTWLSFLYLAWVLELPLLVAAAVAAPLAAALVIAWWWRRRREDRSGLLTALVARRGSAADARSAALWSGGKEALEITRRLLGDLPLQARMAGLGVVILLLNAAAQWLVFRALGGGVSLLQVAVATTLGLGAGVLAGTPGGLGATEAALIACYGALGVDRVTAVAGTLLYRGLHYALVLALGLAPLLWFELAVKSEGAERGRNSASDSPGQPARSSRQATDT